MRSRRWASAATALSAALLCLLVVAGAGSGTASAAAQVDRQAWAHTGALPEALPYQEGRLYVAATAGQEQARGFFHVDVGAADPATLPRGVLLLVEDPDDTVLGSGARLSACVLAAPAPPGGRYEGPLPAVDCTVRADLTRAEDGVWSLELGVFAPRWASGPNHGLAVFPASTDPANSFRLSVDPMRTTVAGFGAVVPQPQPTVTQPPPAEPEPGAGPAAPLPPLSPPSVAEPPPLSPGGGVEPAPAPTAAAPPPPVTFPSLGSPVDGTVTAVTFATLALLALGLLAVLRRRGRTVVLPPRMQEVGGLPVGLLVGTVALSLLPLTFSEVNAYKAGLLLVFLVGALGLHVLVNWTGQLSLAHAGMVGLPAFAVIALSDVHDVSPLYLLPVGMVVGGALGAAVSLPTIRAKGLQVTLVTFAAGIAIDRYFFTQTWLVGDSGDRLSATPALGPWTFETSRELYPVVLVIVALTVAVLWVVMHSRLARAWFWIQEDEPAAATYGVPVATYKILAYVVGGVLAGLSGGLTAVWVQQLSSTAFPASTLSFTYLLVVVLAGRGFAGGVVAAVLLIEGGRLFLDDTFGGNVDVAIEFIGPVALIVNLILYKGGFNRAGRQLMDKMRKRHSEAPDADPGADLEPAAVHVPGSGREPISAALAGGVAAIAVGLVAIAVAWYQAGNTDELWIQNQELLSGGIGGLALVVIGVGLLIRDRLAQQPAMMARELAALLAARDEERGFGSTRPTVEPTTAEPAGAVPQRRARTGRSAG